jgi:hypothetical protein
VKKLCQRWRNGILIFTVFTQSQGWIEIGLHEVLSNFVRAYDFGGTVYEGDSDYPSLEAALDDLGAGIKAHLDYHEI